MAELPLSEAGLQKAVTDLATYLGIWWWHDRDARRNRAGLPDLILIGGKGTLFRELKGSGGSLSPVQRDVIARMERSGLDVAVWRVTDWRCGRVRRELEAIR